MSGGTRDNAGVGVDERTLLDEEMELRVNAAVGDIVADVDTGTPPHVIRVAFHTRPPVHTAATDICVHAWPRATAGHQPPIEPQRGGSSTDALLPPNVNTEPETHCADAMPRQESDWGSHWRPAAQRVAAICTV